MYKFQLHSFNQKGKSIGKEATKKSRMKKWVRARYEVVKFRQTETG